MNLSEFSIKRPVTVIMAMLMVIVLGIQSFVKTPIDLMPNIEFPMAVVITSYKGAGPEEVENFVTKRIENVLSTVNNLKSIQSQSSEGASVILVEFNNGTDMNFATLQMREKIDLVKKYFPDGVENPMVIKADLNMLPIVQIGVTGEKYDQAGLKKFVEDNIKPRIERLDGVAAANVTGGLTREIKIEVNPSKMTSYGVSYNYIINALQMENINLPGGSISYGNKKLLIRSTGEFSSVEDIKNIPIMLPQGNIIYLRDIAEVEDGYKTQDSYTRMNGKPSIGISVQKQTGANTVKVVNIVKKEIEKIQQDFPDVKMQIAFDQAKYIEKSINNVIREGILGTILAVLIIFVFLKNIRTTLIISLAIPISVISTFIMMYLSKTTLNLISMGGLALGIGRIVDDAIVVQDNIFRHRQAGMGILEAALKGVSEVRGAIIASTLTTIVVFVPIMFAEGIAADIFRDMALAITFSLLASLIVAMTIVPMLNSRMLKVSNDGTKKGIFGVWDKILNYIYSIYGKILRTVLIYRKTTVIIILIIFLSSVIAVPFIGVEFIPKTDEGQFYVQIKLAEGTQLKETDKVVQKVEKIIAEIPEIERIFTTVGDSGNIVLSLGTQSNIATINAILVPLSERKRSTAEIVDELRKKVSLIPGAEITVSEISMSSGGYSGKSKLFSSSGLGGPPIAIEIKGYDLKQLKSIALEVEKIVKNVHGTRQIETSISKGRPEVKLVVNRDKAIQFGLNTMQIASVIRTSIEGQVTTRYKVSGDEIDVKVQLHEDERKTFEQLKDIKILTPTGVNVPLSSLVNFEMEEGPTDIIRKNQVRYVTVTAELFGRDVGSVTNEIKEKIKNIELPNGYSIEFSGQNKQIGESFASLSNALLLSVLLVYMVMAAQFESLVQPFIIMFSVPLAFSGAAIGLALTGRTFNVPAFIGLIMLSGIVVSNAIVLIDYVNQLRRKGMDRTEAIITAGPIRLRPILMTTLTTILCMLPIMLGMGEGSEIQAPLATVVIFGMAFSTILTLVIVPVVYTIFDDIAMKFKSNKNEKKISPETVPLA